jgi:DNA-binding HxlR family transcriptional regulator
VVGRTYSQYCPIAVALDTLGERWTLLVVRELLLGARRYTDLQQALPGISPNLLADRLRALEDAGLVERADVPPPAARTVYALTDAGRRTRDVIEALARFGTDLLDAPAPGRPLRPGMAVYATVVPFADPVVAAEMDEHFRLVVGGRTFDLAVRDGGVTTVDPATDRAAASEPAVVLECEPALLVAARRGDVDLEEAAGDGRLAVRGSRAAFRRFLTLFRLRGRDLRPASHRSRPARGHARSAR